MKNTSCLIVFVFFSLTLVSQVNSDFNRKKWKKDTGDSLIISYRYFVSTSDLMSQVIENKSRKEILFLLGKPDAINKQQFKDVREINAQFEYFVYCFDKSTVDKKCKRKKYNCNPCKRSSITIILKNGFVDDVVIIHAGG